MVKPLLKEVLENVIVEELSKEQLSLAVGNLVLDSRQVKSGDTFVAMTGYKIDARKFIESALDLGAELIFAEANETSPIFEKLKNDTRIIKIKNLREQLSLIASNYYDHPSASLKIIGVTGTNGKTSCSYFISKALQKMQFECYLLGTLGVGQSSQLQDSITTTADAITIQKTLCHAVDSGAQFAAMEMSSHGIEQKRADAVKLTTAVFTNLTRDHLDYHVTMENYGEAKRQLFLSPNLKNAVINMDDRFGRKLAKDENIQAKKWLVTTKQPISGYDLNDWIWIEDVVYSLEGIHAKIYTPWGVGKLDSPLIGEFNLSNLLVVIASLGCIFHEIKPILKALSHVYPAPGRMQKITNKDAPLVIVDYAHSPDALEKSLNAIREHSAGLIWCVFGCGGDRDTGKRPLMASIAEKLANRVVVTTDNPRTESAEKIRSDIYTGFKKLNKITYIADREEAINHVIAQASPDDAILIAGKGHEDYQIIGTEKRHLSDIEIAKKAVAGRSHD